jgi:L-histidine N-alpha-methyltransferase
MTDALRIDTHLDADYFERTLRSDVLDGLTAEFKELPPKWFYDDLGSELFDEITRLEEYYPTEAERSILHTHAADVAQISGAHTLVELGSGTADKTRVLLDAMTATGQLERFIPFDVSEGILRSSSEQLLQEYPGLTIHGVVGDFEQHLDQIPRGGRRVTALLGGTVGNFGPRERKGLLTDIARGMESGDMLLLGTDLVKDERRLVAAYDDARGITAEFNKNVLRVLNRRLDGNFDLDGFEHVARFDHDDEWMDLRLRSLRAQDVHLAALDLDLHFGDGEEMRTEISAKFRRSGVEAELAAVGLDLAEWWTDARGDYALSLSRVR